MNVRHLLLLSRFFFTRRDDSHYTLVSKRADGRNLINNLSERS